MTHMKWFHVRGSGYVEILQWGNKPKVLLRGFDEAVCAATVPAALETAAKELMIKASKAGYEVTGWYWSNKPTAEFVGKVELELAI